MSYEWNKFCEKYGHSEEVCRKQTMPKVGNKQMVQPSVEEKTQVGEQKIKGSIQDSNDLHIVKNRYKQQAGSPTRLQIIHHPGKNSGKDSTKTAETGIWITPKRRAHVHLQKDVGNDSHKKMFGKNGEDMNQEGHLIPNIVNG